MGLNRNILAVTLLNNTQQNNLPPLQLFPCETRLLLTSSPISTFFTANMVTVLEEIT